MLKNDSKHKLIFVIILIILLVLVCSNIIYMYKYYHIKPKENVLETVIFNNDSNYDENNKYYTEINYKKFSSLLKQDKLSAVAIIDNSSKTYNRFLETINYIAYRNKKNIYVLELSKLSKKNEISFYEVDDRLKDIDSDYIIGIANDKVVSITNFNQEDLTYIIEYLK